MASSRPLARDAVSAGRRRLIPAVLDAAARECVRLTNKQTNRTARRQPGWGGTGTQGRTGRRGRMGRAGRTGRARSMRGTGARRLNILSPWQHGCSELRRSIYGRVTDITRRLASVRHAIHVDQFPTTRREVLFISL